jgi:metal-sulfur cluster biosynthetic enzyme
MVVMDKKILDILSNVPDPEVPVLSVLDLGIVRDVITHVDGSLEVLITPTYTGCPAMDMIAQISGWNYWLTDTNKRK